MTTFHYNADCKQPDPEIWGGGAVGGPLLVTSGQDFLSYLSKKYIGETPTLRLSDGTDSRLIKKYIGDYPTFRFGSFGIESLIYNVPENVATISFQGEGVCKLITQEELSTANLLSSGFITERRSYDYSSPDSDVEFLTEDDGLITSSVTGAVDYGWITDPLEEHLDYGSTEILESTPAATGLIQVSGVSDNSAFVKEINTVLLGVSGTCIEEVSFDPPIDEAEYENDTSSTLLTFDNTSLTFDASEPKPNIKLTGSSIDLLISNTPEETIDIQNTGTGEESVGYDYSFPTIVPFVEDDDGLITDSVAFVADYGFITGDVSQGNDDLGLIINSSPVLPFGTIANITGSAIVVAPDDVRTYNASGEYRVSYSPDDTTGTLFGFGEKLESAVYDYNLNSENVFITTDDGLITSSVTLIVDYGFVYETAITGSDDYLTIEVTSSDQPFGSLSVSGSADTQWINKNFSGSDAEGEYRVSYSPDDTTGTLFGFGERIESTTYDYNDSAALILESADIGLITEPVTSIVDYGSVTEIPTGQEDDGLITVAQTLVPFGGLSISGSAETDWTNKNFSGSGQYRVIHNPEASGSLFGFGEKLESRSFEYSDQAVLIVGDPDYGQISVGSTTISDYGLVSETHSQTDDLGWVTGFPAVGDVYPFGSITISGDALVSNPGQTPEGTVVISISGIKDESVSYIPEINKKRYDLSFDSGTISLDSTIETFDDTTEQPNIKLTGSYDAPAVHSEVGSGSLFNLGVVDESATYDYNNESAVILITTDSGLITDAVTNVVDYGLITDPVIGQDDDGLISDVQTVLPFGGLTVSGSADVEYRNVNIYAEGVVSRTFSPDDTTGTLFGFGEKLESVTHRYTEQSVLIVGDPDYGVIAVGYTRTDDYGVITEVHGQTDDLGWLVGFPAIDDVYPYGSISILGSAEESSISSEVLAGLFVISGSAILDYTPEFIGSGPINVSGSAHVTFSPDVVASDTATISGILDESRVRSYNESSILNASQQLFDYGLITDPTTALSADYGFVNEIPNENTEESGVVSEDPTTLYPFGSITISGTPLLYPDIDLQPAYTGSGIITISGSSSESETEDFGSGRRRGGNIRFCGDAETPRTRDHVGFTTNPITLSGTLLESETDSYIGLGTIFISGDAIERDAEAYVGLGTATFSGTAVERFTGDTPDGTQLFTIYGELNHPDIDLTPHYGIEKNIGVGTTGIQISGTALESESDVYTGLGTVFTVNGLSPQDTEAYPGGPGVGRSWSFTRSTYIGDSGPITITTGVAQTHYYSPIYPRNALIGDPGSGTGLIRINDDKGLAFTRAVLPIFGRGKIYVLGIGTTANGDLEGAEIGAFESFTPATEIGVGLFDISGIAETAEINVFGFYGDDADPGTSGLFTISSQTAPLVEKFVSSWVGIGTVYISDRSVERNTESYFGSGRITALSGAAEAYSAQTPEDTANIIISGDVKESFTRQPYNGSGSVTFSGACTVDFTPSPDGSGIINIDGDAIESTTADYVGSGEVVIGNKPTVDSVRDTVDSEEITSDEQGSAHVSFVANPPEDTVLFRTLGNADTSETALYTEIVTGLFTLSGTHTDLKLTNSESGIGTIFVTDSAAARERDTYIGSGSLFAISSSDSLYSAQTPENTVILQISGSAITSVESEFSAAGVGLFSFDGNAITAEITSIPVTGSGIITISGQLVHPDVAFIPSPDGFGTINVLGSSTSSLQKVWNTTGTLFGFGSGFESLSKSTYIGVGTIYVEEIDGSTINNPYQIPRSYVCII